MKLTSKLIAGAAALAFLTIAAGSLQAQVTQAVTITATASIQGNSSDNGTITTTAAPTKFSVTTKAILIALAVDESAEGKYPFPNTTFPSGAKLVQDGNTGDLQVVDKSGNLLVDVSDIMGFNNPGNNNIFSGKQNDNTQLASPSTTGSSLLTLGFDDTAIIGGEGIKFYLTGIGSGTTTDTTPNINTGAYTETDKGSLTSGTGEGTSQGAQLLISGTASATGTAKLVF
jgi:hypothetical protein